VNTIEAPLSRDGAFPCPVCDGIGAHRWNCSLNQPYRP
jgi:hypothetical protein